MISNSPFDNLDWKFLEVNEGFQIIGYVPKSQKDLSGVTIATGVDLRFQTKEDLQSLGLNENILQKLLPFMKKQLYGQKARQKLQEVGGLILTQNQAILLSKTIRMKYYKRLQRILSQKDINITKVPIFIISVLYSVVYHQWSIDQNILNYLVSKQYYLIPNLLRQRSSDFKSRCEREAKYIQNRLKQMNQ